MVEGSKFTSLPNEILDRIFANFKDESAWTDAYNKDFLNLCKTHRNFKASAQRIIFSHPNLTTQHVANSTGASALFAQAIEANPSLTKYVQGLQLDCSLDIWTPWGKLVLDKSSTSSILAKLTCLEFLSIRFMDQQTFGPQETALVRDIVDMVRDVQCPKLYISCSAYQLSKIHDILRLGVPIYLDITPETRDSEYGLHLQLLPGWASHFDFSNLRSVIFGDVTRRLLDMDLTSFATAPNLKELLVTLDHESVEETIVALEPFCQTIEILCLQPNMRCEFFFDPWHRTDFSTFSQIKTLSVPSSAWWPTESCRTVRGDPGLAWELQNRHGIVPSLPPAISTLQILFKYPEGVFVREGRQMGEFEDMSEEVQVQGCSWILELLQSGVQEIVLTELYHEHEGSLRGSDHAGLLVNQTTYHPPDTVAKAFAAARVKLDIQLLHFDWEN